MEWKQNLCVCVNVSVSLTVCLCILMHVFVCPCVYAKGGVWFRRNCSPSDSEWELRRDFNTPLPVAPTFLNNIFWKVNFSFASSTTCNLQSPKVVIFPEKIMFRLQFRLLQFNLTGASDSVWSCLAVLWLLIKETENFQFSRVESLGCHMVWCGGHRSCQVRTYPCFWFLLFTCWISPQEKL